jgi:hypothetical protein
MTAVLIDEHVHEKEIFIFDIFLLYIILQPIIDVKDCTHYCGAHIQVKTWETSCEVVLSYM